MLDDGSLLRLAEMGVDVYAPRGAPQAAAAQRSADFPSAAGLGSPRAADSTRARVVLLARTDDTRAKGLLTQVIRALAFARIDGVVESIMDDTRFGNAAALVVFGDALASQAGTPSSADRLKSMPIIAAGDAAGIAASASAKRALWSELRRMTRVLRAGR